MNEENNPKPTSDSEVGVEKLVRRHFIVFYKAIRIKDGAMINGYMEFDSETFLNKKITLEQIKEKLPDGKDIVFTNIIELSGKDFEDWAMSA